MHSTGKAHTGLAAFPAVLPALRAFLCQHASNAHATFSFIDLIDGIFFGCH